MALSIVFQLFWVHVFQRIFQYLFNVFRVVFFLIVLKNYDKEPFKNILCPRCFKTSQNAIYGFSY